MTSQRDDKKRDQMGSEADKQPNPYRKERQHHDAGNCDWLQPQCNLLRNRRPTLKYNYPGEQI